MNRRPGLTIVALIGVFMASALPVAWSQAQKKLPTWAPSEVRLKQLADESQSPDGWAIRPPRDCLTRVTKDPKETRTTWAKQFAGALIVTTAVIPTNEPDLDRALESMVNLLKGRLKNMKTTPSERGLIDGRTFIRTRFSGESLPNVPGMGYGFIYVTIDAKTHIIITGMSPAANIEDLEASAQTFRIVK